MFYLLNRTDTGQQIPMLVDANGDADSTYSQVVLATQRSYSSLSDAALTRPNDTNAYAAHMGMGDGAGCLFKFTNFFRVAGGSALFAGAWVHISKAAIAVPSGISLRAHFFNTSPSSPPAADQSIFTTLVANAPYRQGAVDFPSANIGGTGSNLFVMPGIQQENPWLLKAADGSRDLWAIVEANAAFTPVAQWIMDLKIAALLN